MAARRIVPSRSAAPRGREEEGKYVPKIKTHSGAKKRFDVTGSGKVVYKKNGRNHKLSPKGAKRLRRLRQKGVLTPTLADRIKSMMPYA
jgi:large subunit ribosomal protein L35